MLGPPQNDSRISVGTVYVPSGLFSFILHLVDLTIESISCLLPQFVHFELITFPLTRIRLLQKSHLLLLQKNLFPLLV